MCFGETISKFRNVEFTLQHEISPNIIPLLRTIGCSKAFEFEMVAMDAVVRESDPYSRFKGFILS